jgi:hypothetical protein
MSDVTARTGAGRTAGEIREYLLTQFNLALRRPGMFGGEAAIRLLAEALAFTDSSELQWHEVMEQFRTQGAANSAGVRGAFQQLWGHRLDDAMASVYAQAALPLGWIRLDRALTPPEFAELRDISASWSQQNRTLAEVLATYGPPSIWSGGTNPYYPKTFGYTTAGGGDPLVCFHLWNQLLPAGAGRRAVHDEPVLLAVRHPGPGDRFAESFTHTPAGLSHRRAADAAAAY